MNSLNSRSATLAAAAGAERPAQPMNPSSRMRRAEPLTEWKLYVAPFAMVAMAMIGVTDASIVAQGSYTGQTLWCPFFDGCNTVAQSPYARIFGVPLSFIGVFFHLHIAALAAALAADPGSRGLRAGALGYTAAGVAYSLYSMYLQVSVIRAACSYCLISALVTFALFAAAVWRVRTTGRGAPTAAGEG